MNIKLDERLKEYMEEKGYKKHSDHPDDLPYLRKFSS